MPFFSSALEPRRFPRVDFCRGEITDRRASAIFRAYRYVIMRSPFHVRRSFFRRVHDARCTAPDLLRHPLAASVTGMYYEALADQTSFFNATPRRIRLINLAAIGPGMFSPAF